MDDLLIGARGIRELLGATEDDIWVEGGGVNMRVDGQEMKVDREILISLTRVAVEIQEAKGELGKGMGVAGWHETRREQAEKERRERKGMAEEIDKMRAEIKRLSIWGTEAEKQYERATEQIEEMTVEAGLQRNDYESMRVRLQLAREQVHGYRQAEA